MLLLEYIIERRSLGYADSITFAIETERKLHELQEVLIKESRKRSKH